MIATLPDLLRLLVVPVFAWAAIRDIRTRRIPNWIWPPLYAFGAVLLIFEAAQLWPFSGFAGWLFLFQTAFSLLFVVPLGYAFWYLSAFGGADARALTSLAILFPTFPTYEVAGLTLPLIETQLGVFSLTILTNAVLLPLVYPLGLAGINLLQGEYSTKMFFARPVATDSLSDRHGSLFEDDARVSWNGINLEMLRMCLPRNGLDLDALRMYLRWRGETLADLRENPDRFRDPASVGETHDPTDGRINIVPRTDGGIMTDGSEETESDPWAAERFFEEIDHGAYGTDAKTLRDGLAVVAREDRVLVSPGMPFVVPMAVGLGVSLTFGDILFALLGAVGLV